MLIQHKNKRTYILQQTIQQKEEDENDTNLSDLSLTTE